MESKAFEDFRILLEIFIPLPHCNITFTLSNSKKMLWFNRDKERQRFYLLPGMGGKALRRKNAVFLTWSIIAGLAVSLIVAIALYIVNVNH